MIRSIAYAGLEWSQLWRLSRSYNRHKVRILMYHGVTDQPVPNWTQVSTVEFDQQMRCLKDNYAPVSLQQAEDMLAGRVPMTPHAVAVTFDDGFRNNFTQAYPILKKYQIPATVFVTTSFLDRNSPFSGLIWTDYVYVLLEGTSARQLDLRDQGLDLYDLSSALQRYEAKGVICNQLKHLGFEEKNRIVDLMRQRLGNGIRQNMLDVFGPMSWQELRTLAQEGLVAIGAHTVNHEILSRLPEPVMREEIIESQRRLEKCLNQPVRHFAYPNGTLEDFTEQTTDIVRSAFTCAVTTISGQNDRTTDRYLLRRIAVGRGTPIREFKLGLSGVLDLIQALRPSGHAGQSY